MCLGRIMLMEWSLLTLVSNQSSTIPTRRIPYLCIDQEFCMSGLRVA